MAGGDQGWDDEFAGVLNRCKQVLLTAEADPRLLIYRTAAGKTPLLFCLVNMQQNRMSKNTQSFAADGSGQYHLRRRG